MWITKIPFIAGTNFHRIGLVGIWSLLCGVSSLSWAAPIHKNHVSAEAKWVIHLDMDSFKQTELYRHLQKDQRFQDQLSAHFAINDEEFKLDFTRCSSLTAFGTDLDLDEARIAGVVKLDSAYRQELLASLEKMTKDEDSSLQPIKTRRAWHGFNLEDELHLFTPRSDTFVIGSAEIASNLCAQVMSNKGPGKAPAFLNDLPLKPAPILAIAYAAEISDRSQIPITFNFKLNLPSGATNLMDYAQLEYLQKIAGAHFCLGEATNSLWGRLQLNAKQTNEAGQIQKSLQNLVSVAKLFPSTNAHWQTLLKGLRVENQKSSVVINFAVPIKMNGRSLYDLMEKAAKAAGVPMPAPAAKKE